MPQKYIFLCTLLVIFALSSCKEKGRNTESFEDFSSSFEDVKNMISDEAPKGVKQETKPSQKPEKREIKPEGKTEAPAKEAVEEKQPPVEEIKPAPQPAKAKEKFLERFSNNFNLRYLSFDVANFYSELEESGNNEYIVKFYSRTNGFVDYLFGWMSYTSSHFKLSNNGEIIPQSFKTKVKLKGKLREIELKYDPEGKLVFEQVTPPDNRDKRPAVAEELKKNTFDPLTIGIEARRMVIEAFEKDSFNSHGTYDFSLPLYDGRRRSDIIFKLFKKKADNNYRLSIRQKKIAGFTDNELADENRSDKAFMDIYVEPNSFVPIEVTGKSPIGTAYAKFVGNCPQGLEKCIIVKKK